jgi:hypothetical protein
MPRAAHQDAVQQDLAASTTELLRLDHTQLQSKHFCALLYTVSVLGHACLTERALLVTTMRHTTLQAVSEVLQDTRQ